MCVTGAQATGLLNEHRQLSEVARRLRGPGPKAPKAKARGKAKARAKPSDNA